MIRPQQLTGVIAQLALNYGKSFDTRDAVVSLANTWAQQLGTFDPEDLDLALEGLLGDPNVTYFPTVADIKRRCALAAMDRRRTREGALPDCAVCDGTGWLDAGTDANGYDFVKACPRGCPPPKPGETWKRGAERQRSEVAGQGELLPRQRFEAMVRAAHAALTTGTEEKAEVMAEARAQRDAVRQT